MSEASEPAAHDHRQTFGHAPPIPDATPKPRRRISSAAKQRRLPTGTDNISFDAAPAPALPPDAPVWPPNAPHESDDMRVKESAWDIPQSMRMGSQLRALREGKSDDWTMDEFVQYLRFYKRRAQRTVNSYRRQLEFMGRHPVAPVRLHGSRAALIESFSIYATAREQIDGMTPAAMTSDHKAVRALGAFLSIPDNVWPVAPRAARTTARWVPSPEQVHELLYAKFGPERSYEHHLTRFMLAYCFGVGIRPPSELRNAKVTDVDLDHDILVVEEQKKGGSRRELVVEPAWLLSGYNKPSLKRWIEGPRNLCGPKTDALFPNVDGKPFPSQEALGVFLNRQVRGDPRSGEPERFAWYSPYVSRHWSCNARLIDTARVVQGQKVYDWNAVARWHGHESVKMTMSTYARSVEVNEHKYGRNWIARAFGGKGYTPASKSRKALRG